MKDKTRIQRECEIKNNDGLYMAIQVEIENEKSEEALAFVDAVQKEFIEKFK